MEILFLAPLRRKRWGTARPLLVQLSLTQPTFPCHHNTTDIFPPAQTRELQPHLFSHRAARSKPTNGSMTRHDPKSLTSVLTTLMSRTEYPLSVARVSFNIKHSRMSGHSSYSQFRYKDQYTHFGLTWLWVNRNLDLDVIWLLSCKLVYSRYTDRFEREMFSFP